MTCVLFSAFKRKQTAIASTHLETCSFTSYEFFFSFFDEPHKLCAQTQTFNLEGEEFLADNSTDHEGGSTAKRPIRVQGTCPLLNGKVASWSLRELCWKGAQGQLCGSWQMHNVNLKCLPSSQQGWKCEVEPNQNWIFKNSHRKVKHDSFF